MTDDSANNRTEAPDSQLVARDHLRRVLNVAQLLSRAAQSSEPKQPSAKTQNR
jgi:hypothetical protein